MKSNIVYTICKTDKSISPICNQFLANPDKINDYSNTFARFFNPFYFHLKYTKKCF